MTTGDQNSEKSHDVGLVNPAQSRRLMALSRQLEQTRESGAGDVAEDIDTKHLPDEWRQLRQLIDAQLRAVWCALPEGKRNKLFRIRFGMNEQQLKALPMLEIADRLKLKLKRGLNVNRVVNLDYNGRSVDGREC